MMNKTETKTLYEVTEIIMGQSPDSESYNDKGEGIPFYQGKSDFGEVYPTVRMYCTSPKKIAMADDILMSVRAPIGDVNIAQEECCIGRGLAAIRPKENINLKYLFYLLDYYKERLAEQGTGSTFKAIGKDVLKDFNVPIWPFEKQQWIADIIDEIQELIFNRKEAITVLDNLVKSRFIELFGNDKFPTVHIEDVCSNIVDCPHTTPKYQGELLYPAIRTTEIKAGFIDWSTMKYVAKDEYDNRISRLKPIAGDIVYGREGTYGNAAILPDGYDFCLGQRVMLFRADSKKCLPQYLLQALISDDVKRQADSKNMGATVAHVNVADAKRFFITLPPIDLQNQFADFVALTDKSKLAVQQSIETLQTLKAKLMQDYFG